MTQQLTTIVAELSPAAPTLPLFDSAVQALAEAHSVDEVKQIRDQAEAMRAYVKQASGSRQMANQCAELKLRAERKLGEMLGDSVRHEGGRRKQSHDATVSEPTLEELGVTKSQSSRWQRIAGVGEVQFESYLEQVQASPDEELTSAGLLRAAGRQNVVDVMGSSESYEWYTPSEYVEAARTVMGGIDLDPASSPAANRTVRAGRYYTIEDDGLSKPWTGRVWLNPPYGLSDSGESNQAAWSKALLERYAHGGVEQALLLVTASTAASWFQPLWDYPLCFVSHRIQFEQPSGKGAQPTHGSAFVYLGARQEAFAEVFAQFGRIVVPSGNVSEALKRREHTR